MDGPSDQSMDQQFHLLAMDVVHGAPIFTTVYKQSLLVHVCLIAGSCLCVILPALSLASSRRSVSQGTAQKTAREKIKKKRGKRKRENSRRAFFLFMLPLVALFFLFFSALLHVSALRPG